MTDYRRNFLAGGGFFFTVNLAERHLRLLTEHIDKLRSAFRETRRHHPFTIDAMVVLDSALNCQLTWRAALRSGTQRGSPRRLRNPVVSRRAD